MCPTILSEVDEVLRIKFNRNSSFVSHTLQVIRDICDLAEEPATRHQVAGDSDDSPILRAALSAGVDYLVTRDGRLLAMNPTETVRIISLADYLQLLREQGISAD